MSLLAHARAISDVCILVQDIEASIRFYTEKLGYQIAHRMPGFADFMGPPPTLALWDIAHINRHTAVGVRPQGRADNLLIAVRLPTPAAVDQLAAELAARGVVITDPPSARVWRARCAYFKGPDGEVWELYAWLDGAAPGEVTTSCVANLP
jgi:catechol 2,3-dioxygenase-like lactoylglutathione lyase family enzyme